MWGFKCTNIWIVYMFPGQCWIPCLSSILFININIARRTAWLAARSSSKCIFRRGKERESLQSQNYASGISSCCLLICFHLLQIRVTSSTFSVLYSTMFFSCLMELQQRLKSSFLGCNERIRNNWKELQPGGFQISKRKQFITAAAKTGIRCAERLGNLHL